MKVKWIDSSLICFRMGNVLPLTARFWIWRGVLEGIGVFLGFDGGYWRYWRYFLIISLG